MELAEFSASYVSRYALAAVRVLAALGVNPLFGSARVPLLGRVGIGLFLTLVLFPPTAPVAEPVAVTPLTIASELLIGLLAGYTVAVIFAAAQFAGALIGLSGGFLLGATVDPQAQLGSNPLEQFFYTLALLVFVQINGHHLFLLGLHELFAAVPVGQPLRLAPAGAEQLGLLGAALLAAGVKLAFPVLAALLIADLGLAILARVAPQLNLFVVGLPLKLLVALGALAVALPVMLPWLAALFRAVPPAMRGVAG
jgi:flagellar biosynthetic protein FliR